MSMPHFGAIEEFKRLVDECYKFMNKKRLPSRAKVCDQFCTEFRTEFRGTVTGDIRPKSNLLDAAPLLPHVDKRSGWQCHLLWLM
jgi:hypothetical protein